MRFVIPAVWIGACTAFGAKFYSEITQQFILTGEANLGMYAVTMAPVYMTIVLVWLIVMAGVYLLLPPDKPNRPPLWIGLAHSITTILGFSAALYPQVFVLLFYGKPDRFVNYAEGFDQWNTISNSGVILLLAATAFFFSSVIFYALKGWRRAG